MFCGAGFPSDMMATLKDEGGTPVRVPQRLERDKKITKQACHIFITAGPPLSLQLKLQQG
jgi:hypothetical protein